MQEKITLKVAGGSSSKSVAGSIVKSMEEGKSVELSAIGAGAVNQAAKAVALARTIMSSKGYDLYISVGFDTVMIDGEEKTALKFIPKLI
jgi:stage V sporulation protein S